MLLDEELLDEVLLDEVLLDDELLDEELLDELLDELLLDEPPLSPPHPTNSKLDVRLIIKRSRNLLILLLTPRLGWFDNPHPSESGEGLVPGHDCLHP